MSHTFPTSDQHQPPQADAADRTPTAASPLDGRGHNPYTFQRRRNDYMHHALTLEVTASKVDDFTWCNADGEGIMELGTRWFPQALGYLSGKVDLHLRSSREYVAELEARIALLEQERAS